MPDEESKLILHVIESREDSSQMGLAIQKLYD